MNTSPQLHRSTTADERAHISLLLQVARMYYQEGATQAEVARAIGYSRPTVSRLLTQAREQGIVHIRISHPLERAMEMEQALQEKYTLHAVRIADPESILSVTQKVARCAADYIVETSREDIAIAISNGLAVNATIESMPQLTWRQSRVFQMIGSVGGDNVLINSPETCRRMAVALGGRFYTLPAPLIVPSGQVADLLKQSDQVAPILELASRADMALVGIGAVESGQSGHIFDGFSDQVLSAALAKNGAVGHICGHHFDAEGNHVITPLCERTVGLGWDQMKRLPRVIGVAWGSRKVPAIRAAMRGRFISVLITDRATATELLKDATASP